MTVLQSALWVDPADGEFGPQTKAAVVAYQKAKKLTADGVVTSPVWRALSADAATPGPKPAASFTLTGSGFGHGVGMSQYGAYAQALSGRTVNQILQSYYPGTSRTTISDAALLRVNLLAHTSAVTLRVAATGAATGTVYGRVTGASKAVTFTAADTVVVRPNSRNGQDVAARRQGGRVDELGDRRAAGHVDRHPGLDRPCRHGAGHRHGHLPQPQRPGLPLRRDGRHPHRRRPQPRQRAPARRRVRPRRPRVAVLLGPARRRRPAGPGPRRAHLRLHGVPRRCVAPPATATSTTGP